MILKNSRTTIVKRHKLKKIISFQVIICLLFYIDNWKKYQQSDWLWKYIYKK